jgi:RHS repeat-associated protein
MTNDGTTAYTWNEFSKMKNSNGGNSQIYDAFGRTVEIQGASNTQIWYTQLGKTAFMNGSTDLYTYFPTPGNGTVLHPWGGNFQYMHKDWLGSVRLISSALNNTIISDRAIAPYGEVYDIFGGTTQNLNMFGGGSTQDVLAGMYDTPNRELQGSQQGRWLSPDPAASGWNQYAYATNPNGFIDPAGLGNCDQTAKDFSQTKCNMYDGFGPLFDSPSSMFGMNGQSTGTVGADGGTVSAETLAYFDSLDGTQGDVTQERDDSEPVAPDLSFIDFGAQGTGQSGPCTNYVLLSCGAGGAKNGQTQKPQPQTKQQKCAAAKANLAAIDSQGQAMAKMNLKELGAGAGIGCVVGFVGTEEVLPVVGTPLAVGDCAVGAIGGALTAEGVFFLSNFGDIVSGNVAEAKAIAQVVENCL